MISSYKYRIIHCTLYMYSFVFSSLLQSSPQGIILLDLAPSLLDSLSTHLFGVASQLAARTLIYKYKNILHIGPKLPIHLEAIAHGHESWKVLCECIPDHSRSKLMLSTCISTHDSSWRSDGHHRTRGTRHRTASRTHRWHHG
jgi:hypothetical protein